MLPHTYPLAEFVTICETCGREVISLYRDDAGKSHVDPCGHKAALKLARNPRLRQA